jgi:hypothetical protein
MNEQIIKRNLDLVSAVTHFILEHPHLLEQLPPDFKLVILPEDDSELSQYNLNLLTDRAEPGRPGIIVRLMAHQLNLEHNPPRVYIPLAA